MSILYFLHFQNDLTKTVQMCFENTELFELYCEKFPEMLVIFTTPVSLACIEMFKERRVMKSEATLR